MAIDGAAASGTGEVAPHGTFTVEATLPTGPDDVWQAVVRGDRRGRWLRLPGRPGPETARDLEPGTVEILRAQASIGDTVERLERTTQVVDLVPGRRAVLVYRAVIDDRPRWASLVTVSLAAPAGQDAGAASDAVTQLTWTEQYSFLEPPGADDVAHLRGGTRLMLNGLARELR